MGLSIQPVLGASLGSIEAKGAIPLVLADAADTNPIVRLYAVETLSFFKSEPGVVVAELKKLNNSDADSRVRANAARWLSSVGTNVTPRFLDR